LTFLANYPNMIVSS